MLTRIRNAQAAAKNSVSMPSSKVKLGILKVLQEEGYINGYQVADAGVKKTLTVDLKYVQGRGVIDMLKRASRPGLRLYKSARDLPKVKSGLGITIVSTSKGIMSDSAARKSGQGGEVICLVA